ISSEPTSQVSIARDSTRGRWRRLRWLYSGEVAPVALALLGGGGHAHRGVQRPLELLEHPDHAQTAHPVRARAATRPHALGEVLALDPERLDVGDRGGEDVARAGDVLAVAA